jgi:hypothetical protein
VASQQPRREAVGALAINHIGEAQLGHEPVLDRAPQPLDATLGLR